MANTIVPEGLQPVEILHVDTQGSQEFFVALRVNDSEKCDCQRILFELFSRCCQQYGGHVAANWAGDGGHAFFPATHKSGQCIQAAKEFISKIPILAQQTTTTLGRRIHSDEARRKFRIKAHFGLVRITSDAKFDAASAAVLDAFLKNEGVLAPVPDELFITEQLFAQLGSAEKSRFKLYRESRNYGALTTALYQLESQPTNHARSLLQVEEVPTLITESEWDYLVKQIRGQAMNVIARNSITIGLTRYLANQQSGWIDPKVMEKLTMRALFNYLKAMYPQRQFHLALWKEIKQDGLDYLEKVAIYPTKPPMTPRRVQLSEINYQAVISFVSCAPVVTQCVTESRISGEWVDFDPTQEDPIRGLHSAIQVPIYRPKNRVGEVVIKETLGVLSVDTDKPDFFLVEEVDLWTEDLRGYLANLALAEHIRRADLRGAGRAEPLEAPQ